MKKSDNKNRSGNNEIIRLITEADNYRDQGKLGQANCLYQQVSMIEPDNIFALNGLGLVALDTGMLSLAIEFFNAACDIDPDHKTVNKNLALVYTRMSRYNDAILHYMHILNLDEDNGEVHGELARLYLQEGNLEHALSHYRLAFKLNPADPRNFHGLVQLDAKSITPENIDTIEEILIKPDLPLEVRSSFYFGLGTVYDITERYDEAFANYSVANISKGVTFDAEKHAVFITDIIDKFTSELFEQHAITELNGSTQPVFIIGMPRSGTTLVEQVLASHSDVYAAGELNLIAEIAQKLEITAGSFQAHSMVIENSSAESYKNHSKFYINEINNLAINDKYKKLPKITDKMPMNFLYLGLIALLFPNAKIIHCRRNPLDVCLSCYFQNFSGNHSYASDLKNIAFYYQQYERLMAHWEQVLPVEIHTVDYEEMTTDSETTIRKIIEFADLDWQESCMEFHKTKRHVNTASLVQVRKKMYQSSVNRWLNYDKYLNCLKKTLSVSSSANDTSKFTRINAQNINYGESKCNYLH